MMLRIIFTVGLSVVFFLTPAEGSMLPDASVTWTARPTWLDNPAYQENASQEWIDGHLRFQIAVPETGMKWLCTFPPTRMDRSEPFARITYRASHVAAIGGYSITAMSGNGDFPLLMSDRILSDGEWHTVTVPVPSQQKFSFQMSIPLSGDISTEDKKPPLNVITGSSPYLMLIPSDIEVL